VVLEPRASEDSILRDFSGTGVRIVVGDIAAEADRIRMADPAWADSVARAVYRGIGTELAEQ
jgi:N-acetylmuramoyl-L-alanine amidase